MKAREALRAALAPAAMVLALGCAGAPTAPASEFVEGAQMAPRLQYVGFSIERPAGASWFLRPSEQKRDRALLRRDVGDLPHSFFFEVQMVQLERAAVSHEEFAQLARMDGHLTPPRFELVTYRQERVTVQGQWCIRYDSTVRDLASPRSPGQVLVVVERGFVCKHPSWPGAVVTMHYSEQALPDGLLPVLYAEGEELLRGTRIEIR